MPEENIKSKSQLIESHKFSIYKDTLIRLFINRLKLKSSLVRPKMLNYQDYYTIGDKSYWDSQSSELSQKHKKNIKKHVVDTFKRMGNYLSFRDHSDE